MAFGKAQSIRRGIVQLKTIQAVRRQRMHDGDARRLAFGVCESISYATGSTGKPVGPARAGARSAYVTAMFCVGAVLLLALTTLSVVAALSSAQG